MSAPPRRRGNPKLDDQGLSEGDQTLSVADRMLETARVTGDHGPLAEYERAHAERDEGTISRVATAAVRALISGERDEQAEIRDENARLRDDAAAGRDRLADLADRRATELAEGVGELDARTERVLQAAATARTLAAAARARAATDRENAARDRAAAAQDRKFLRDEMERSQLDELTGAYRRGLGELLLRHEMRRADRQGGELTLVFVDADYLKKVNARSGHAAGDAFLRQVCAGVRANLRSYDPIVRWGGDEFVCTISGIPTAEVQARIEGAQTHLGGLEPPVSITFGLAAMETADSLAALVSRADDAQRRAKDEKHRADVQG